MSKNLKEARRHADFCRIHDEFVKYYKDEAKGEKEYYTWLNALRLNETLCYSQTHEKFQWAKDMLKKVGEDAANKYYKVLVAFPLQSMNGNIYHEADLREDAQTITKGHPSIKHEDRYWLSPDNPYNPWGTVNITGAEYEDGAVEALMQVPKTTLYPLSSSGEKLCDAIDRGEIVNVSLEGFTASNGRFHFDPKIPFTLLPKNVLPGIPLARVFPIEQRLEAYLPNLRSSTHHRTIKIVGLEKKMTEKQLDPENDDEVCAKKKKPEADMEAVDVVAGPTPMPNPIKATITQPATTSMGGSFPMPDNHDQKTVLGESVPELKLKALRAEQKAAAAEVASAETAAKLSEAYTENSELKGELKALQKSSREAIERLEKQVTEANQEKTRDIAEKLTLTRRLEDMTTSRDNYKTELEKLKDTHEKLQEKYRETLKINLAIEKKLTESQEDCLKEAKRANSLEESLGKAKNLAGKIRVIGLDAAKQAPS